MNLNTVNEIKVEENKQNDLLNNETSTLIFENFKNSCNSLQDLNDFFETLIYLPESHKKVLREAYSKFQNHEITKLEFEKEFQKEYLKGLILKFTNKNTTSQERREIETKYPDLKIIIQRLVDMKKKQKQISESPKQISGENIPLISPTIEKPIIETLEEKIQLIPPSVKKMNIKKEEHEDPSKCVTCKRITNCKDGIISKCDKCNKKGCMSCLQKCSSCKLNMCDSCNSHCKCFKNGKNKEIDNGCQGCHPTKKCTICKEILCPESKSNCFKCENDFCEIHLIFTSGNCHKICHLCDSKLPKCIECKKVICCRGLKICSVCSVSYCGSCIYSCQTCKEDVCSKEIGNLYISIDCVICRSTRDRFIQEQSELCQFLLDSCKIRSFFTTDKSNEIPLIKIGHEYLSLPFTKYEFEKFHKYLQKSPFGKGEETIFDETFRKGYEISKEKIHLSIKLKDMIDSKIIPKIKADLSPENTSISCELYKMVIYDEGGFFKPHKDTQRTQNHFGTLILFLPSVYEGGDFIISHGDITRTFNHSVKEDEELEIQWLSFFADCVHEIKPLTSGCRATLTFNLFFEGNQELMIPDDKSLVNTIEERLDKIFDNQRHFPQSTKLCFLLSHDYTDSTFSPIYLKGNDINLYSQLCLLRSYKVEIKAVEFNLSFEYYDEKYPPSKGGADILFPKKKDEFILYVNEREIMKGDIDRIQPYKKNLWETGNEGQTGSLLYKVTGIFISKKKRKIEDNQMEETSNKEIDLLDLEKNVDDCNDF